MPTCCQIQQEELLAEGIEVREKKRFPARDDQNYKFYPRRRVVRIKNIFPNVLTEVAEQLELPSAVTATDNPKQRTLGGIKCLTALPRQ